VIGTAELIERLSEKSNLPKDTVAKIFSELSLFAYEHGREGFSLPGFGQFVVERGENRLVTNPGTGQPVTVRGRVDVYFKPDSTSREKFLAENGLLSNSDSANPKEVVGRVLPELKLMFDHAQLSDMGISGSNSKTKIGGTPDWIQVEEQNSCCGTEMTFYAQFDSSIGGPYNIVDAGMLYVFVCDQCGQSISRMQCY